jgi:hypothetical protein
MVFNGVKKKQKPWDFNKYADSYSRMGSSPIKNRS